jgi:hypothetical protein
VRFRSPRRTGTFSANAAFRQVRRPLEDSEPVPARPTLVAQIQAFASADRRRWQAPEPEAANEIWSEEDDEDLASA